MVKSEKPDLLVTDMLVPKFNGLEICKAVRSCANLSRVRIVAITSINKKLKFRLEGRDVRVDAYVEKPFDVFELAKVIQGLFPGDLDDDEINTHVGFIQKKIKKQGIDFGRKLPSALDAIFQCRDLPFSQSIGPKLPV